MVSYSPRAAGALAFLKRPFNDIDIFVEDTGNRNMWLILLRNLLPSNVALASVNMLGGRGSVIDACKLDQGDTGRKKLYIIDSDLDHLQGKKKTKLKYLHRVRAYCIENLLFNELSLLRAAMTWSTQMSEQEILAQIDYKKSVSELRRKLMPLFVLYAVANKLAPELQTVKYAVKNFYTKTDQGIIIDEAKVRSRFMALYADLVAIIPISELKSEYKSARLRARELDLARIVSGKDYVLPYYMIKICHALGFRGNIDQLKVQLAAGFDASVEPYFARSVILAAT